jgi:hypothetical protein
MGKVAELVWSIAFIFWLGVGVWWLKTTYLRR